MNAEHRFPVDSSFGIPLRGMKTFCRKSAIVRQWLIRTIQSKYLVHASALVSELKIFHARGNSM
jgi:hypothetical protein